MIRAGMRADSTSRRFSREMPLGLAAPDHTVPYGTVLSRDTFPGTSCLATIVLSLRDADQPEVLALSNVQTPRVASKIGPRLFASPAPCESSGGAPNAAIRASDLVHQLSQMFSNAFRCRVAFIFE